MTNDKDVICHLVAMSLLVMWHLNYMSKHEIKLKKMNMMNDNIVGNMATGIHVKERMGLALDFI